MTLTTISIYQASYLRKVFWRARRVSVRLSMTKCFTTVKRSIITQSSMGLFVIYEGRGVVQKEGEVCQIIFKHLRERHSTLSGIFFIFYFKYPQKTASTYKAHQSYATYHRQTLWIQKWLLDIQISSNKPQREGHAFPPVTQGIQGKIFLPMGRVKI